MRMILIIIGVGDTIPGDIIFIYIISFDIISLYNLSLDIIFLHITLLYIIL